MRIRVPGAKLTRGTDVREALRRLVTECRHPGRLLELYYWSAEPDLAEVMRQYIALPLRARTALHAFLTLVKDDPCSVNVRVSASGDLTFSSPAAKGLEKKIGVAGGASPLPH
jgi:hypothetical protein